MSRYIDADELLEAYDREHKGEPGRARQLIEEAPTVIELPCKVGDMVYWVNGIEVQEYTVKGFEIYGDNLGLRLHLISFSPIVTHSNLFYSREEAEKALKERTK